MTYNVKYLFGLVMALSFTHLVAQPTVRFDATEIHQHITGFGGFVCSPQFQYGHMSTADIKKVWGPESTVGCNIMRMYIPIGKNTWSQSLQTAKTAKQLGLIVFASPWGQPAEWKTNNSSNAKTSDGKEGRLKRENWPDYAQYLEDYVQYLRQNGVELDAISIQNEPDWAASYAGCLWSTSEMAEFVKTYGPTISCKVMAPESIGCSDGYVNALNKTDVLNGFDIYGGHQYGGIQSAYKNLAAKGKEIWMTEYLINWNENKSDADKRNFDFSKDFFDFFRAINTCMVGDFNAWIHYAAKRYYAMLGDGTTGAGSSGTVTKRGYVMAHFAKFVTGMTRIDIDFGSTPLEGSAYLSQTGDTVVAVVANASNAEAEATMDIPFYTMSGKLYSTTKNNSMTAKDVTPDSETCRPVVRNIPAQSVSTIMFIKSRERQVSNMKGTTARFDRLDDMNATKSAFGTNYKMSGKSKKLDHSNPLISTRTDASNGYVALDERYSRLVIEVKKVTSTMNYSSAKTTLIYVNNAGGVSSHDYGDLSLERRENFTLTFDLSPATLPDGCIGLISLTNNNWSSTLTLTLGDVTLDNGSNDYAATLSGNYVEDDSYVQEYTTDAHCTSIDLTACDSCPSTFPWLQGSNRVVWLPEYSSVGGANLIHSDLCHELVLSPEGGDFRPQQAFTAEKATLTVDVDGCRMVMLPFMASVPENADVYAFDVADLALDDYYTEGKKVLKIDKIYTIAAHFPVLVVANGRVTFEGRGNVDYAKRYVAEGLRGTYNAIPLYAGDYVLDRKDGVWGFRRLNGDAMLQPFDVYAAFDSDEDFIVIESDALGINSVSANATAPAAIFDLQGRQLPAQPLKPGIYIKNGKKYIKRQCVTALLP